jgi:polyisoprenoid-binding protein YceI
VLASLLLSALIAQATAYSIDPAACEAGFELKATMHTVHGSTRKVSGEVRATPEEAGALSLSGRIEIDAAALETGNEKRDATMRRTSLLVASFPAIVFEPERFSPTGPAGADGAVPGILTGRLTIRGVSKAQAIVAGLAHRGARIVASGSFDLAWADFGVPDPSFFVVRIDKTVHARFNVTFVPVP